jgi:hypothetical protein
MIVKQVTWGLGSAVFVFAAFVVGSIALGSTPAKAAADQYGCRGDQACIKIAETTKCDWGCQQGCKAYRYDYTSCYAVWGPKFDYMRKHPEYKP